MSNEDILNRRWQKTDKTLKEYLAKFQELSRLTLDDICDLFDSLDIVYKDINKRISLNEEKKLKRKINQWNEDGILIGYFLFLVESKNKYSYADMIEILLYGLYMQQYQRIQKYGKNVFNIVANDIYDQAVQDIGKEPKKFSLTWEMIQSLLWIPTYNKSWNDYLLLLTMTNVQESYKDILSSIQKNKLNKNALNSLLKKQMNRIICVNDDKFSGVLNDTVRALANEVYIEPFKEDKTLQVRFIAEIDKRSTEMCLSMNDMLFYVNDWNEFTRYSDIDKRIVNYKVYGLERGINLPPITNHFHWCRSTITYLIDNTLETNHIREELYIKLSDIEQYINYIDILGEETVGSIENFTKIKYNKDTFEWESLKVKYRKLNTVISGARNTGKIKTEATKQRHADIFYESVRKRTGDAIRISNNTKWSVEDVEKIRNYIFIDKHKLMNGEKRFDSNYDMAVSWQRLNDGHDIKDYDLVLLEHEYYEMTLVEKGYSQYEAHIEATKKYNYAKGADEYNDRSKKS